MNVRNLLYPCLYPILAIKEPFMARAGKKSLLKDVRGAIGGEIVVKQYDHGIVISKYPDMSRVKRSKLQKKYQKDFKQAVAYAQSIIHDPVKKAAFQKKLKKGKRVYTAAIKEYLES
jgi:hypothetical protein